MDPTTLVLERATAEWTVFLASVGSLAFWGAAGLMLLLGIAVVLTPLMPQPEPPAADARGPVRWNDMGWARSATPSGGRAGTTITTELAAAGRRPVNGERDMVPSAHRRDRNVDRGRRWA